ncbi:zinc-binding alcohol dehydrogenase family protein [Rhodococcus sp. ACPA1]|uniref:quinone oxidoreductase family protein n=1 Tax=Rhodococcus sp. ACPA1 TaxID=2028572 RepID=UPI000BB117C8|nr:zinc-binding alcohol dehydrogenase family protein [Rhodococcus sp. ACPA1]PBC47181.1 hypothetical protein CJ177_43445 [Rhodococcus sp. ACPA1]
MADTMRALLAHNAGDPKDLRIEEAPIPTPEAGEVLIRITAAAVNRSDALSCRGILPGPFPRILGRDFAGVVVAGSTELEGVRVWGSGGRDLGLAMNGSHAEYMVAPVSGVTPIPDRLSDIEAGASGLAYFTAAEAIARAGGMRPGKTCIVTGAAGGVGGAVAALAHWQGMRVVGVVKSDAESERLRRSHFSEVVPADAPNFVTLLADAAEEAVLAVDVVGGSMIAAILPALAVGGGLCILGAPAANPLAAVDTLHFYRQELRLVGLHTGRLTSTDSARVLASLADGFASGALVGAPIFATYPLDSAQQAYHDVESGVAGRPVLVPAGTLP